MRISDWSSDVCSSDLGRGAPNLKSDDNGTKRRRRSASMTPTRPAPGTANLLRSPVHPAISEALVRDLVFAFYTRLRVEGTRGPLFDGVIGEGMKSDGRGREVEVSVDTCGGGGI